MSSIVEQVLPLTRGCIVYDAARLRKPAPELFTREYWALRSQLEEFKGGRGSVCVIHSDAGEWILRHYRRGGFAARISADRYLYLGADTTRAFREWRLLAELCRRGLPVPQPVAARFERDGLFYRADIITVRLDSARTLTQTLYDTSLDCLQWQQIGRTIARFHAAGVHHADLNANNIMLRGPDVYLIDFDRGRFEARGSWEQHVVGRLRRSLDKLKAAHPAMHFDVATDWPALVSGLSG